MSTTRRRLRYLAEATTAAVPVVLLVVLAPTKDKPIFALIGILFIATVLPGLTDTTDDTFTTVTFTRQEPGSDDPIGRVSVDDDDLGWMTLTEAAQIAHDHGATLTIPTRPTLDTERD